MGLEDLCAGGGDCRAERELLRRAAEVEASSQDLIERRRQELVEQRLELEARAQAAEEELEAEKVRQRREGWQQCLPTPGRIRCWCHRRRCPLETMAACPTADATLSGLDSIPCWASSLVFFVPSPFQTSKKMMIACVTCEYAPLAATRRRLTSRGTFLPLR
ncbi:unnamed protein product [Prorocentrum cordatum]|uniref:Uncharacterized protein n=1 Tax=Prorocentrum cordatum TaxID=2364126 RepID=A0ABN9XR90_9DINO|nr:unnamed protein product [Polarella glacialis]